MLRMMSFAVMGIELIALAPQSVAPAAAQGGACVAAASAPWTPVRGRFFRTEAFSQGPSCTLAVVTLVIRASDGKALWVDAAPVAHLMTFVEVKTRAQMARALKDWISQTHMFRSTAELPAWPRGAEQPASGEFPFYPEAGTDRDSYEQIRASRQPLFCYVQGMESMACIALSNDGQMTKVGVQSFPG